MKKHVSMRLTRSAKTILALALATMCMQASAHRAWLKPAASHVEGANPTVTIDAAVSDNLFDIDHVPLKLDGLAIIAPDGASVATPPVLAGRQRNSFDLPMAQSGTYKLSLVSASIMASYKDAASGETRRFRGSQDAFAKEVPAGAAELKTTAMHSRIETFVTANKPNSGALKASGVGLEMVPLTDPTGLRSGETARWRFQLDGKPLADFPFSLIPGGVRYRGIINELRLSTDAKGEASVTLPAAGMYWLNAGFPLVLDAGANAPAPARRFSYAATLEVLPD